MNIVSETKKIFLTPSGAYECDSLFSTLKYKIPGLFAKDKFTLYHTIKVLHCEIPFSFYIVNDYNNKLVLSTGTITITNGNYNANTFMTFVQARLPVNMTITFSNLTGRFTLTYNTSFSLLSSTTCSKLIGCATGVSIASSSNVIILPYLANFMGTKNIYINVPNISLDNFNSRTKTYTTLLCIANNVPPYGIIMYDNRTANKNTIKGSNDDILEIEIIDDDGNDINFNNTEWSITIEIETFKQLIYYNNSTLND